MDPQSFDQRAPAWDDDPRRRKLAADVFSAVRLRAAPAPTDSVLDFGCGTGALALPLAPLVHRVLAADFSRGMLDVLENKARALGIGNVETLQANLAAEPAAAPGPFDLVVSAMAIHHVVDVDALLRAFFSRLAPSGRLAVVDLDAEDGSFHGPSSNVPHLGFRRDALAHAVERAGFRRVQFHDAAQIEKNGRPYSAFLAFALKPPR